MNEMSGIKKSFVKELPFFLAIPALLWQVVFLYIPLVLLLYASFLGFPETGSQGLVFTLEHYTEMFSSGYFLIILRSCILALVTAVMCVVCAYPIAYYLAFKSGRLKNLFFFFLMIPFWTSLIVQVYAWLFVLGRDGLINSLLMKVGIISQPLHLLHTQFAIYLGMLYCYVPFMVLPIYSVLEKFDMRLLEASADLGASMTQTFRRVIFPLSSSGIKTGFFLVFVPAFGEFVIPAILGGGKQLYVGSLISHYFLARDVWAGSAFTWVSGLVLIGCVILVQLFFRFFINARKG